MYERPAMDVTNTEMQNAVAESLLGEPKEQQAPELEETSEYRDSEGNELHGDTALSQEHERVEEERFRMANGDAAWAKKYGKETERREDDLSDSERSTLSMEERILRAAARKETASEKSETSKEQSEQQPELTAEQFAPIIESTYKTVKDLAMVEAPKLAADLAPFFSMPLDKNAEEIGLTLGGLTLGASQLLTSLYKDGTLDASKPMEFEKLAPLPAVACNYLAEKWCAFRGQSGPANDPVMLGNALRNGIANLIHSKGKTDAQMAVWFVQAVEKASTGRDVQVDAKEAMDFVNALTPHIRAAVGKFNAAMARTEQAKPKSSIPRVTNAKKYQGIRTPTLRREVRKIGNGLDAETLAVYQREHGRL